MKCLNCNAKWKIGNQSPKMGGCPICEKAYDDPERFIWPDSYEELAQLLLKKTGPGILDDVKRILAFYSDIFPETSMYREELVELFNQGLGEVIRKAESEAGTAYEKWIDDAATSLDKNRLKDIVGYLSGRVCVKGTDLDSGDFYAQQMPALHEEYKQSAVQKTIDRIESSTDETKKEVARCLEKGLFIEKDIARSIEIGLQCSNKDPEMMFQTARRYLLLPSPDVDEAISWLLKAGDAGHLKANYFLYRYFLETNSGNDYRKFLKKAAKGKYLPAVFEYALELLEENTTRSIRDAVELLKTGSDAGDDKATEMLHYIYKTGTYVEKDIEKAALYSAQ